MTPHTWLREVQKSFEKCKSWWLDTWHNTEIKFAKSSLHLSHVVLGKFTWTSSKVSSQILMNELVQFIVHNSTFWTKFTVPKTNYFIVLFLFNMLLQAIIFQNYCHSSYRTTDRNYFISFYTVLTTAGLQQYTAKPGCPAAAGRWRQLSFYCRG